MLVKQLPQLQTQAESCPARLRRRTSQNEEPRLPDSHALEHLGAGVERKHGGAADAGTVQEAQGQALHEGQGRRLGGAVVDDAGDGGLRQDGVDADNMAVLQLQHAREEGLGCLEGGKKKG